MAQDNQIAEVVITLQVTGVDNRPASAGFDKEVLVKVQTKDVPMEIRYKEGLSAVTKWHDWATATYQACLIATKAELDSFEVAFDLGAEENHRITVFVPASFSKGDRIGGSPMIQVENQLKRKGFDCDSSGSAIWVLHRPDPRDGYSKRGYFDAAQVIRLAAVDGDTVDETIKMFWSGHLQTSSYARYLSMRGERRGMATKKAAAADEAVKKQITVKALDGTEVNVSPKQQEMLGLIKERSASGSPVGSDEERLDDPSSIAVMKLATGEHPVVLRSKFGSRWHYFAAQCHVDKAVKAAEDEVEAARKAKAAKKPTAKNKEESETAPAKGGKKPLKKPSEK